MSELKRYNYQVWPQYTAFQGELTEDNEGELIKSSEFDEWNTREPQSEWVSVGDRLPDEGDYVIVVGNGVTQYQTYFHEECMVNGCSMWFCYSDEVDPVPMSDVTHWQPLPTAPKGG